MTEKRISEKLLYPSRYVEVNGSKMHYVEAGSGQPILFLHGIPTSCYVWRNIIPHLAPLGLCIAPDLIGFGKSDKPNIEYSVFDHIKYIDQFIEKLGLKNITLVMHGWGSVIGLDYAMRNPKNVTGLIFYEPFLRSMDASDEMSLPFEEQINTLHEEGYDSASSGASFIDKMIPQNAMRHLTTEEMNHYREPFLKAGTSKPIVQYLEELSSRQDDSQVNKLIADYSKKLTQSKLPKLMLYSVPGFVTTIATAMWAKDNFPNLEIVDIGEELHFAQESYPDEMGETISVWLQGVEQNR